MLVIPEYSDTLRWAGEKVEYTPEMLEEWQKCRDDIVYFAEKYCYVNNLDRGYELVKLRDYQKELLLTYLDDSDPDKMDTVVLSSRQSGKTETSAIFMLHYILFNVDKKVAVLANQRDLAYTIVSNIKMKYERLPKFLQQGIKKIGGWSAGRIALENGCEMKAAATTINSIRGFSFNVLFLDEFGVIDPKLAKEFITAVIPTVTSGKTSKIIISSTPKGVNQLYDIWEKAIRGVGSFKPVKIDWRRVPGRDDKFRKKMIENIGMLAWRQEYECEFLGSSKLLVDGPSIEKYGIPKEPISDEQDGNLRFWEEYRPGCSYVMGLDPAVGNGGDYSCIQVFRIDGKEKLEQVATFSDNMTLYDKFCAIAIDLAKRYGNPPMMVENNGVGQAVVNKLFYDLEYDNMVHTAKKGIGCSANRQTKLDICLTFKRYFENGWIKLNDARTIRELTTFEEVSTNVFKATKTSHDDLVMSAMWAVYYLQTPYFDEGSESNPYTQPQFPELEEEPKNVFMSSSGYGSFTDDDPLFDSAGAGIWSTPKFY